MSPEQNLYPIRWNGKNWDADDVDELFFTCYTCEEALNDDGGVYVTEGLSVYPDGSFDDDFEDI